MIQQIHTIIDCFLDSDNQNSEAFFKSLKNIDKRSAEVTNIQVFTGFILESRLQMIYLQERFGICIEIK